MKLMIAIPSKQKPRRAKPKCGHEWLETRRGAAGSARPLMRLTKK